MSEMDDLYAQVAAAPANGKGDNFRGGKGVVLIRELILKNMNDGPTFVLASKIVESGSKGDTDPVTKAAITPNAVGSTPSWPQKLTKHKSAAGNVKAFILAALGFNQNEVKPADFQEALKRGVSREQPMRGMLVGYETYQQPTRSGPNAGRVNTYVRWIHVPPNAGNDAKSIADRRAALDKSDPLS